MTGLGYDVDTVRARLGAATPDSWALLLDPVNTAKLKARITNAVTHPNGYSASLLFLDEAIRNDASIYPDAAARARFVTTNAVPAEYTRLVTREWTRFRTRYWSAGMRN